MVISLYMAVWLSIADVNDMYSMTVWHVTSMHSA